MKWIGAKTPNTGYSSVKELIAARHLEETESEIINLNKAVDILKDHKGPILIVGDYDVDGIMASAIMYIGLKKAKYKNVKVRLPKRIAEGYGISTKIIDEITEPDTLIITVDNGISAVEPIRLAKDRGYKVIVTDHHQPPKGDLPPADIIVDPHLTGGEYVDFCGAGLALMFVEKLLGKGNADKLYPYAYFATIADVVPLTGDNRRICRKGRNQVLPKSVKFLMEKLQVDPEHYTEEDLKFSINPSINAISRIEDNAEVAFRLFTSTKDDEMVMLADQLVNANVDRKKLSMEHMQLAEEIIEAYCMFGDSPMILELPDAKLGIIGIIAGKIAEEYNVPVIVLTKNNGILKGSARVPATVEYNIKEALDDVSDLLIGYGGHKMAAGLSLRPENIDELRAKMQIKLEKKDRVGVFDLAIKEDEIPRIVEEIQQYGPYGPGNEVPVVKIKNLKLVPKYGKFIHIIGDTQKAAKMFSPDCTILYFCEHPEDFSLEDTASLDVYGELSVNWFRGMSEYQIILRDTPHKNEVKRSALADRLAARAATY